MTAPAAGARKPDVTVFHPERLIAVLGRFKVRYVLVGEVAARLQGYPWLTARAEVCPAIEPANFESLATALAHLGARVYTDGTPDGLVFDATADALARAESWRFVTSCGRVDVAFRPAGTEGYRDLVLKSVPFQLHGDSIAVAALDDIVRMKVAGAGHDRREVALLTALAKRADAQPANRVSGP